MVPKLNLAQKGLILIAIPLFFELVFIGILAYFLHQSEVETQQEARSKAIVVQASSIVKKFYDAGTNILLYGATKSERAAKQYEETKSCIRDSFAALQGYVGNDSSRMADLASMERAADTVIDLLNTGKAAIDQGGPAFSALRASQVQRQAQTALTNLIAQTNKFVEKDRAIENSIPIRTQNTRHLIENLLVLGIICNIGFAITISLLFSKGITSRIAVLSKNTQRLAKRTALLPPLSGEDEVSQLDKVFREMAEELTSARQTLEFNEARLKLILENIPVAIFTVAGDGTMVSSNTSAQNLFGYRIEQSRGIDFAKMLDSEDGVKFLDAVAKQENFGPKEFRAMRADGGCFPVELTARKLYGQQKDRLLVMLVDLTEKHEVAQMKQQFVAMVSHDLRSPLTSLLAFLDTLYKGGYGFLTEHGSGSSRLAQQSVKRLIALINDLLDIEKVEAGRLQLRKRQLRVEHLLSRATETVQWLADQAAVSLVTKSDVYRAIGDEDQLLRVLVNLIGNAIKFSPPGSTVEILVKKQPDRLEFHVVDSGCGISASDQAIIFDRFRQTTLQSDQLQGGSGLGLAICKALIAAHDGQIGVFSELGKGSDFWFTLPNNSTIF